MLKKSRTIAFPFRFGADGGVAYVEEPEEQYTQFLQTLVRTRIKERKMVPTYGSSAHGYQFENINDLTRAELSVILRQEVLNWVPGILVQSVEAYDTEEDEGVLVIDIRYSIPPSNEVLTATVDFGGLITGGL